VRAELQQELADARTNNEELARENDEQAQQIESLAAAFAQAQADLERRNGAIEQFEQSLAAARETAERERQGAEAARQSLAKAELKLDALPAWNASLRRYAAPTSSAHGNSMTAPHGAPRAKQSSPRTWRRSRT